MKKILIFTLPAFLFSFFYFAQPCEAQFLKRLKEKVKETAADHVINDAGNATDKTIDKTENTAGNAVKGNNHGNNSNDNNSNNTSSLANNSSYGQTVTSTFAAPTLQTYKNYDFVPGDSIIFADDFSDDQVGELPAHWILCYGQGQVNAFDGKKVFVCTAGAGGDGTTVLEARMKKKYGYMPKAFTAEFDMFVPSGAYDDGGRGGDAGLNFYSSDADNPGAPIDGYADVDLDNTTLTFITKNLTTEGNFDLPDNIAGDNFNNRWHHVAIAYRDGQMKIYLDQNRIYEIPQVPDSNMDIFGIRETKLCYVTNIRLAEGGGMAMLRKKFTAAKIITHGITFDVNKADIKPESMGTLNMIVGIMNNNPDLKFEIDGHTDNTGDEAHNLTLSQQRADAVKAQLVKMGIDASRLTTKGFGDTKPIANNSTPDGRANNRRVEFVRL